MPEYDINRDQWGNPIERDRHAGSVWDIGPNTPGYRNVCGYPVRDKIPQSEIDEEKPIARGEKKQ